LSISGDGPLFSKYNGESATPASSPSPTDPWKDAVTEMTKTNYEIYDVLLGKRPPFAWMMCG